MNLDPAAVSLKKTAIKSKLLSTGRPHSSIALPARFPKAIPIVLSA